MKTILGALAALTLMLGAMSAPVMAHENPCNPCSMKHMQKHNPCNPCSMKHMQKHNPCNPCSMKHMQKHNPCNPCSMKHMQKHNPCNPCSMKKMKNPCSMQKNPCSADAKKYIRPHAFNSFQEAVDMGRKMWNDDEGMGKAGVACLSCHADFDMLHFDKNQNFPHYVKMVGDVVSLDQMINYCLLNPMQGHQLDQNSKEMTAMAAYYRSYRMQYLKSHRK